MDLIVKSKLFLLRYLIIFTVHRGNVMKRGKDLSIISLSAISDFARVNSEIQLLEQMHAG